MYPMKSIPLDPVGTIPCSHLFPKPPASNYFNQNPMDTQTKTKLTSLPNQKSTKQEKKLTPPIRKSNKYNKQKNISRCNDKKPNSFILDSYDPCNHLLDHFSQTSIHPLRINPNLPIRRSNHPLDECITH